MTHFNEETFNHHDGRGNLKASLAVIVEAIKKLSKDVEALKAGAPASKPTAKISTEEVVNALKTKVSDVVEEVVEETKVVVADVVAEVKALGEQVDALVTEVENLVEEDVPVTSDPTEKTAPKKKTK